MTRPKHPKPDKNNNIVPDAMRELGSVTVDDSRLRYTLRRFDRVIVALKIADLPGQTDWLILENNGSFGALEVKEPGKERDLTPGECDWMETLGLRVVTTKEDVLELLR